MGKVKTARVAKASLGLGLTLAAYGTLLWGVGFVLPESFDQRYGALYAITGLMGVLGGFLVKPFSSLVGMERKASWTWLLPVLFVAGCALLVFAVFSSSILALIAAGLMVGCSVAGLFLFWLSDLSSLSAKDRQLAFVPSILVAATMNVVLLSVPRASALVVACVATGAPLAVISGLALKGRTEPGGEEGMPASSASYRVEKAGYQHAFRAILAPLACAGVLSVIIPALNYVALQGSLGWEQRLQSIVVAQVVASVSLLAAFRLLHRPPYMEALYLVVSPLLIIAMFMVPFAGLGFSRAFLVSGSCLFFMVTVFLMLDCVHAAQKTRTDCAVLYGVCGAVTFLVRFGAEQVMRTVSRSGISLEVQMVATALFVVYLLGFAFVVLQNYRKARERLELAESAQSEAMLEKLPWSWSKGSNELDCCLAIGDSAGLSDRELEVFQMLLRGKNVPTIAEELFISQNTVRSHVKRIYRLLDVHSRAELITLFETALETWRR